VITAERVDQESPPSLGIEVRALRADASCDVRLKKLFWNTNGRTTSLRPRRDPVVSIVDSSVSIRSGQAGHYIDRRMMSRMTDRPALT
jgi:hypothetical protein